MWRASVLIVIAGFASTLLSGAQTATPAAQSKSPTVQELLKEANELWNVKLDFNGAMAAFNRAVEAAPDDLDIRLQRGLLFEVVSVLVKADAKQKFEALARADFQLVADDQSVDTRAGVARDGLTRLSGQSLLNPKSVECSKAAEDAYALADSLYGARKFDEAMSQFEKATASCPAASSYWVRYAEACFGIEQFDKAKELCQKAIEVDRWDRSAHRRLADTEWYLKNAEASVHEAALAVVSDPVYEAAWASLQNYGFLTRRSWKRVYAKRPGATSAPSSTGGVADIDVTASKAYGVSKAGVLGGTTVMTALGIERNAVRSTLQILREIAASDPTTQPGPFWSMMARAEEAGFLDEAIFLHLLDAPLAKEYPEFREDNAARLTTYLETLIVPKQ
jgi:tetratricopeptide (TPR) repeat protein